MMLAKGQFPEYKCTAAIFADTRAEKWRTYEWLKWLAEQLSFPVFNVSSGSLTEASLQLYKSRNNGFVYLRTLIPMFVKYEDGRTGILIRKCSRDFKILAIEKKLKEIVGRDKLNLWRLSYRRGEYPKPIIRQLIGISADEPERLRKCECSWCFPEGCEREVRPELPFVHNVYPLVEKKITRDDCTYWMRGYDYPEPPRSSCFYCPYQSDAEWLNLTPEEFEKACRFERAMQALQDVDGRIKGQIYLHSSCVNLDEVVFKDLSSLAASDCVGVCMV